MRKARKAISCFWRDRRGVGAVEFALIAPLLLMIYITVFELTIGLSVSKRVARASGAIADLVTQQPSVSKSSLAEMMNVAQSIFVPYGASDISLDITGIKVGSSSSTVAWSWNEAGGKPYGTGSVINIPAQMKVPDSFIVHAELSIPHRLLMFMPGLLPSEVRDITIRRDYYFRSRSGKEITCADC
ncbi:TadE/TadG family type IV pilus assembly protein [Pseudorhizobium halotolerans]|uniref:TadE/TadG family type IV pilus assembly protein n=1 Tax=Pseudorhizobium halotolerans TaxID=1233081 RepID=UPI0017E12B7D|nr:TadE/TadG family type IV pilus assembly protein [Pseudorhizobium halotolerans]